MLTTVGKGRVAGSGEKSPGLCNCCGTLKKRSIFGKSFSSKPVLLIVINLGSHENMFNITIKPIILIETNKMRDLEVITLMIITISWKPLDFSYSWPIFFWLIQNPSLHSSTCISSLYFFFIRHKCSVLLLLWVAYSSTLSCFGHSRGVLCQP